MEDYIILSKHLNKIDIIEFLHIQFNQFWKSLETDVEHIEATIQSRKVNGILYLYIILPEKGINELQVTIACATEDGFNSIKNHVQRWNTAQIVNEENEYVVFIEANYVLTSSRSNVRIYDNWKKTMTFADNVLKAECRKIKIDSILKDI